MSRVISVEKEKTNVSQLNRSDRSINLNLHTQNCTGKEKIVASLSCQFTSISGIAAHWHSTVFLVLKVGKNKKGSDGEGKQKWFEQVDHLSTSSPLLPPSLRHCLVLLTPTLFPPQLVSDLLNSTVTAAATGDWQCTKIKRERERASRYQSQQSVSVCGNINKSRCTSWFRYI